MNLEVKELRGGYGAKLVLDGIDFEVDPGSVVTLLGSNGCGKSTLLKMIGRILSPTRWNSPGGWRSCPSCIIHPATFPWRNWFPTAAFRTRRECPD